MTAPETATRTRRLDRRWGTLVVICVGMLLSLVEGSFVGVAVPTITEDLRASTAEIQWLLNAFPLAFGGLVITCGGLADRKGHRATWLFGVALFGICAVVATFAADPLQLILARAGFGVSTALVVPSSFAIVGAMFDDDERPRVTGVMAMSAGVMQAVAPLLGGILLSTFWWGSIYLVIVPLSAVVLAAGWWLVPASAQRRGDKPDLVGSVLSIAAVTTLVWVVINAPTLGWLSRGPVIALGIGLALLVAFLWWERVTTNPMLELSLFRRGRYTGALLAGLVPAFCVTGALFLVTQHLQFQLGLSPWQVGLAMVPFAVAMLLAAGLVSARLARVLSIGRTIAGGLMVSALVLCFFGVVAPTASLAAVLVILVLVGFNVGICAPLTNAALIESLPKNRTGVGTGVSSTTQQFGNALGVAALGVIFSLRFAAGLPAEIPHDAAASLPAALAATVDVPKGDRLVPRVYEAFASGVGASMLAAGLLMAVGAVAVAVLLRRGRSE